MTHSYICINCFSLKPNLVENFIICPACNHEENIQEYETLLQNSADALRYGYQYRIQYEEDLNKDPRLLIRHHLLELNQCFEFITLAAISGIVGNFTYDAIKSLINGILNDSVVIELNDKEFKKKLADEGEQEKFIKYIQEYRDNKLNTDEKVIKAIEEEILVHKEVEKFEESPRYKEFLAKAEKLDQKKKKKRAKKKR